MSQPVTNPRADRSVAGMVVALLVAVGAASAWYLLAKPNSRDVNPVPTVPWQIWVNAGAADHRLALQVPSELPTGWRATSANYQTGVSPRLDIGLLTANGKFVGLEESLDPTSDMLSQYVDKSATQGKDVTLGGHVWQTWTDAGGDYALIRTVRAVDGNQQRILVYGSAPDAQIRTYAAALTAPPAR
ncbi:MAG: hypothetical protein JWR52_2662 [Marmoricola sp.]|nr:hypothetical protein [Marmoricola sp.]